MAAKPIDVLVVDDSALARDLLVAIVGADPELRAAGTARSGVEAVEFVAHHRPAIVLMDIAMPKMDGADATKRIMETAPLPIVIVRDKTVANEAERIRAAVQNGAVAVVERPPPYDDPDHGRTARALIEQVKLMSGVKVVRRWPRLQQGRPVTASPPGNVIAFNPRRAEKVKGTTELVAIGSSTGGPPVLQAILSRLPRDFGAPILLVQHIATGFHSGFADWLQGASGFPVRVAAHGDTMLAGRACLAPDGHHMGVDRGGRIVLTRGPLEYSLRPSVSHLFRSAANVYGDAAVGVLLTGMGRDGAEELALMREKGAITIAQDEQSSAIHGMPGEAIKLGAAMYVLTPEQIASALTNLLERQKLRGAATCP